MGRPITSKQEAFCVKYLETGQLKKAALAAGYSAKGARIAGTRALRNSQVIARLNELRRRTETEDDAVVKIIERRRILSNIARGRVTDYLNEAGNSLTVGKESLNPGAVGEVSVRTIQGRNGPDATVITGLKLHDPIRAIDMLNKMDGIYTDRESPGAPAIRITEVVMVRPAPSRLEEPEAGTG